MIRSVLVANRGEIARRVFRTCRELGIATVAVHSDADAVAPFVAEADRAVRLPGNAPSETYLRGDLIVEAALAAGADAVHPGYGFLSENADFARAVIDAGLAWLGPKPASIDAMGSKIRAKEIMAAAEVPILSVDPATATAADFPLLVKASAGGGGRGMRVVERPADLDGELTAAAAEAASAFGDPTVFVEPYLPTARHVEVQVLADTHGTIWILGDRDCSIQRRHQKVVEEAPAPGLTDATRATLHAAARNAAAAVDYVGAGTVEFLVDGERVYFLEMNTRLQVEHPVTEEIFGLDLVALQIEVAEGRALPPTPPEPRGHAVEVRLYAEDPADGWAPQTGTIREFAYDPSVRVDSGVEAGSVVSVHYDAMLAKVIAYGADRDRAIRTLDGALARGVVTGVVTNTPLLRSILADEEFVAGRVHTALLDERLADWTAPALDERATGKLALAAALAQAQAAAASSPVLSLLPAAWRNVPSQPRVRRYSVGAGPAVRELAVAYRDCRGRLIVDGIDGAEVEGLIVLDITLLDPTTARVRLADGVVTETYEVVGGLDHGRGLAPVDVTGPDGTLTLVPIPDFVDPADVVAAGSLLAPMPAAVVAVAVEAGQQVSRGDTVVVLEAMKMQHTIAAPVDGVVTELAVSAGQQVESGSVLAVIEAPDSQEDPA